MTEESFARYEDQVALATAAEGGTIAAVDNNREQLDRAMGAFAGAGGGPHGAYLADALQPGEVDAVVAEVAERFGKIDILLNGVGGLTAISSPAATTEQLTMAEWQRVVDFNLNGTFLFCHAVIPHMTRQGGGKIVNFASIAGRGRSQASSSAYAAAKGCIIAFTTKLAAEVGPAGINVNAISP